MEAMNKFHPEDTFENYNENPAEKSFYQGVEKEQTDLSGAAANALKNDVGGKTVVENFGKNQFEINKNNEAIKQSRLIEEESYAITHGISNERVNCEEKAETCEVKNHEEVCYMSRLLPEQTCIKTRKVFVTSENTHQRADFSFVVSKKWTGVITVNLVTGAMTHTEGGSVPNLVKLSHPCEGMTATIHSILNNGQKAYWVDVIGYPNCKNNGLVTLNITKKWARAYPIQVALTIDAHSAPFVSDEYWENYCKDMEAQNGLCKIKKEQCTDANSTKVIDGLPVTRDCWQNSVTYSCATAAADECLIPKEKGCLQTTSRCVREESGACALYEQVYSCQEKVCHTPAVCLKNVFCADGECTEHASSQNDELGESISQLAVAGAAGSEFSKTQASLFAGHASQCKIWSLDLIDCCSDKGWGKKLDLVHCRDEDKALGHAKLNYLVHYLGKYCSQKELGVCVEYKHTYCVFDSKIARIIQEGRLGQLNSKALGSAKHPTCSGLSVGELQAMDLGSIDFVEPEYPFNSGERDSKAGIASDFKIDAPDALQTTEEIKRRIQKKAGEQ